MGLKSRRLCSLIILFSFCKSSSLPVKRGSNVTMPTIEKLCQTTCDYTDWAFHADCRGNNLTSVPKECSMVETIDCRHNRISTLLNGTFAQFKDLTYLDIEMNSLSTIEKGAFCDNLKLKNLYAQFNEITMILSDTFDGAPNLRQLYLNNNNISTLESGAFEGIPLLEILFLSNNKISEIPFNTFHNLTSLTYLYIENNGISDIKRGTFKGLHKLRHLSLAKNRLTHIPPGMFDDLNCLRALKLFSNQIVSISSLPPIGMLKHIDLYNNSLSQIENLVSILENTKWRDPKGIFGEMYLAKNPLTCSCELEPLQSWLWVNQERMQSHHRANVTCLLKNHTIYLKRDNAPLICPAMFTSTQSSDIDMSIRTSPPTVDNYPIDHSLMPLTIVALGLFGLVMVIIIVLGLYRIYKYREKKKETKKEKI